MVNRAAAIPADREVPAYLAILQPRRLQRATVPADRDLRAEDRLSAQTQLRCRENMVRPEHTPVVLRAPLVALLDLLVHRAQKAFPVSLVTIREVQDMAAPMVVAAAVAPLRPHQPTRQHSQPISWSWD
jgi:hypothetical protein